MSSTTVLLNLLSVHCVRLPPAPVLTPSCRPPRGRFAKNLTADKINISTMRGEGEMSNLELNETVMTDLLELPAWMRITRVWCNRVTVRIHWTKLKSVPIYVVRAGTAAEDGMGLGWIGMRGGALLTLLVAGSWLPLLVAGGGAV